MGFVYRSLVCVGFSFFGVGIGGESFFWFGCGSRESLLWNYGLFTVECRGSGFACVIVIKPWESSFSVNL